MNARANPANDQEIGNKRGRESVVFLRNSVPMLACRFASVFRDERREAATWGSVENLRSKSTTDGRTFVFSFVSRTRAYRYFLMRECKSIVFLFLRNCLFNLEIVLFVRGDRNARSERRPCDDFTSSRERYLQLFRLEFWGKGEDVGNRTKGRIFA